MARSPNEADVDEFLRDVYAHEDDIDPGQEKDWGDLAYGWLLARGVDWQLISWELTAAFTCGDRDRALDEIDALTKTKTKD